MPLSNTINNISWENQEFHVICRKLAFQSIHRHFSTWKKRSFSFSHDYLLMTSHSTHLNGKNLKVYPIRNLSIISHSYGLINCSNTKTSYVLLLKYTPMKRNDKILIKRDNSSNKYEDNISNEPSFEFILKFQSLENYELFYDILQMCQQRIEIVDKDYENQLLQNLYHYFYNNYRYYERLKQSSMLKSQIARTFMIPKMNIVLIAVGTRGDVQPFVQVGVELKNDGHRVRVATHECYRQYILEMDLEFYPLGGDPVKLSQFMVKNKGNIIPSLSDLVNEVPQQLAMLKEIIESCWGACTQHDPKAPYESSFKAHAIIANPISYGAVHCAEALSIPLQLMFPQPWIPTKAFPHPLACLSYECQWSKENFISYQVIDRVLWFSMSEIINTFRIKTLDLAPLGFLDRGWNILNISKVPFIKIWSPVLVPKPKDWLEHVHIVGIFNEVNSQKKVLSETYEASIELSSFLCGDKSNLDCNHIIYIGFGSMIIEDAISLIEVFLDACAILGVRVLFQSGWSEITTEKFKELSYNAHKKAMLVKEAEDSNKVSLIFPSPKTIQEESIQLGTLTTREDMDSMNFDFPQQLSNENHLSINDHSGESIHFEDDICEEDYVTVSIDDNSYDRRDSIDGTAASYLNPSSRFIGSKLLSVGTNLFQDLIGSTKTSIQIPENKNSFDSNSDESNHVNQSILWNPDVDAIMIGSCPHSWLFHQKNIIGAVHHGGAGTTTSSLLANLPTWIIPFFGDQFFWGNVLYQRKLGPKPCIATELNLSLIIESITLMINNTEMKQSVNEVCQSLHLENGVKEAIRVFYYHLPLVDMTCDLSMFSTPLNDNILTFRPKIAKIFCQDCNMKFSKEAYHSLECKDHRIMLCEFVNWKHLRKSIFPMHLFDQQIVNRLHETEDGIQSNEKIDELYQSYDERESVIDDYSDEDNLYTTDTQSLKQVESHEELMEDIDLSSSRKIPFQNTFKTCEIQEEDLIDPIAYEDSLKNFEALQRVLGDILQSLGDGDNNAEARPCRRLSESQFYRFVTQGNRGFPSSDSLLQLPSSHQLHVLGQVFLVSN